MNSKPNAAPAMAYSYLRFSDPAQGKGSSLKRQSEAREQFLSARPHLTLDKSLRMTDAGTSAFRGKHRSDPDNHPLAAFLELVKSGRVARGSFLLVESLDRLSREKPVPAAHFFLGLLVSGIHVVQLYPHIVEFDESADMGNIMFAIADLSRAHMESAMKSERVGKAWKYKREAARETGKLVSSRVPGWIQRDASGAVVLREGKPVLDAKRAAMVKRIYAYALDGRGCGEIAKILNAEGVKPVGGRAAVWSEPCVLWLLKSRAVLGEFQPGVMDCNDRRKAEGKAVAEYFPRVISDRDFDAVQGALKLRKKVGAGRRGAHLNVFSGLLRDARTGGSLTYKHYPDRAPVLYPVDVMHGKSDKPYVGFAARVVDRAVLGALAEVKPRELLPEDNDDGKQVLALSSRLSELETSEAGLKAKLRATYSDALAEVLRGVETDKVAVAGELAEARQAAACPISEAWGECQSLVSAYDSGDEAQLTRLRSAVRRVVSEVWCLFITFAGKAERFALVQLHFHGTDAVRHYVISHTPPVGRPGPDKQPPAPRVQSFRTESLPWWEDLRNASDPFTAEAALYTPAMFEEPKQSSKRKAVKS